MQIDIDALLTPVTDDLPQGSALDYDGDFLALERDLEGQPEQQYGETLIPAQQPDWPKALQAAQHLLGRSKDFRLAVTITRALTHIAGPQGTLQGLELVEAMLERYWHCAHPSLSEDGEEDLLPRSNALAALAAGSGLLGDLRDTEVPSRQLGRLKLGVLERIAQAREDGKEPFKREQLPKFLQDELTTGNAALAALPSIKARIISLQQQLGQCLGSAHAPDFSPLLALLEPLCPRAVMNEPTTDSLSSAPPQEPNGPWATADTGAAGSREQAIAMLDAVCDYLERSEPANPAPLLIRRARNMIGADFLTILRDLAPAGLQEAERIAGLSKDN